jgi:hypothetical protein
MKIDDSDTLIEWHKMREHRVLRASLWVLCAVVAAALALRSGWALSSLRWPRSIWPLLLVSYGSWAAFDGMNGLWPQGVHRLQTCLRVRPWAEPLLLLLVLLTSMLGVEETIHRWAQFHSRARYHGIQEVLCELGARGERGQVILGCPFCCGSWTIPETGNEAERANMLDTAERHARLRRYWESRW